MRNKIAAGNWKMNTFVEEGVKLADSISVFLTSFELKENKNVMIFVPYIHLLSIKNQLVNSKILIGAQNCSQFNNGAFTGEISASMLSNIGIKYCIIGHSERRQFFGDTNEIINQKLNRCYENNIIPILCCGEKLEERKFEKHFSVVENQLTEAFLNIKQENIRNTIIAYEPVWAIGTGETATPEQAQEMHKHIRNILSNLYDIDTAENISILYGGSVNAKNSELLFQQIDIDGGLVGGASLKIDDFSTIIKSL